MATEGEVVVDDKRRTIQLETSLLTPDDALLCFRDEATIVLPNSTVPACNNLDEYYVKSTFGAKKTKKNITDVSPSLGPSRTKRSNNESFSNEPFAVPLVKNLDRILKKTETNDCTNGTILMSKVNKTRPDIFSLTEKQEDTSGQIHYSTLR